MSRIISIGKQDFVSLRKNHYFYIDESSFYPHSIEFNKKGLYPTKIRQALCHFSYFLDTIWSYLFSQLWFPTVQDVLQADWQDVWHSPHPPFFNVSFKFFVVKVLILFMIINSSHIYRTMIQYITTFSQFQWGFLIIFP